LIVPVRDLSLAARPGTSADLAARHDELVAPLTALAALDFDPALLDCRVAEPGTPVKREVDRIVDYAYSVRYQDRLVSLAHHIPESAPANRVLAVTQRFDCGDVVVGTCRVAWDDLEVFDLFEVPPPDRWPHELLEQRFGEVGRLALHPIVDALVRAPDPALSAGGDGYRVAVWRCLHDLYASMLAGQGRVFAYHIESARAQRFVQHAGFPATRVDQARPSTSEAAREFRRRWWRYFQPDAEPDRQPHLYYRSVMAAPALSPSGPDLAAGSRTV
jgi:hypothetical protein